MPLHQEAGEIQSRSGITPLPSIDKPYPEDVIHQRVPWILLEQFAGKLEQFYLRGRNRQRYSNNVKNWRLGRVKSVTAQ